MHQFPLQRGLADIDWSRLDAALRQVSLPELPTAADAKQPATSATKRRKAKRDAPIVTGQENGLVADFGIYIGRIDSAGNLTGTSERGGCIIRSVKRLEDPANQNIAAFQIEVSLPKMLQHGLEVFESESSPLFARHIARQLLCVIRELLSLPDSGSTQPAIVLAVSVGQLYERLQVASVQDAALTGKRGKSGRQKGGRATADPELWTKRAHAVRSELDRQYRRGDKRDYGQACAVIAADEVNQEPESASLNEADLTKARRGRAKHIIEELRKRFPALVPSAKR